MRVDDMVTQGEEITGREYYRRLDGLFLNVPFVGLVLVCICMQVFS